MHTENWIYQEGETRCVGYVAYDDSHDRSRPVVLVSHSFEGRNELACHYARLCADLGYVGFAIDLYGEGVVESDLEACLSHMVPLVQNRAKLRARVLAAFEAAQTIEVADTQRIAAMGFCFGAMPVLDLARSGADVKGVVAIHGMLAAPEGMPETPIRAKVLCLHGYQDPQVGPEKLAPFAEEMNRHRVDWQMHYFGRAKHSFTDPQAAKIGSPELGRVYDPLATERSWRYCRDFFQEVLS